MQEKTGKNISKRWFSKIKISTQLVLVYCVAIFLPLMVIGSYQMTNVNTLQKNYYSDMLHANNDGVSQTLYEITTQIYTISDSIVYNDDLIAFLNGNYESEQDLRLAAANTTLLDKYAAKYAGVEEICVYIDREDMVNYGQFYRVTDEIRESDWYQKAMDQYMPFWFAYQSRSSKRGNMNWNLTLVRKMILVGGEKEAVIMIKVRDSYLASRLSNARYKTMFAIDDQQVAFSSSLAYYGSKPLVDIDYDDDNFRFDGLVQFEGEDALVSVSTLRLSKSANKLYLIAYDTEAMNNIAHIQRVEMMLLTLLMLFTLLVMIMFSRHFTGQVRGLRDEMGKASRGEYETMATEMAGSVELTQAFDDLMKMVQDIQQMEADQYEAEIRSQSIKNEQQRMEFKMLSSQINPHFLYNTLETIRMKALAAGDTEVANATKLLGKSMRYVLENTGTKDTTLKKEIEHILIYLQIQKLRFGDRVNYEINVEEGIDAEEYRMLPLLLQPVVENAIVHGLEGKEADGFVKIDVTEAKAADAEKYLCIEISDNGVGMQKEELEKIINGLSDTKGELRTSKIALYNINRRIKLNYGDKYGLNISSTSGVGTVIALHLPSTATKNPVNS